MKAAPKQSAIKQPPAYQSSIGPIVTSSYLPVKAALDFGSALILFVVSVPIILVAAIAIKLESTGPVFFKQERVGLMGKPITIIKLRSMGVLAESQGAQWATKNDPRVTKVGKFIRKTRIDELPQLLNVLRGEMSLIGPRPERPAFTVRFAQEFPGFEQRLRIKPGLSGHAQVNGGYDIDPGTKAKLDCFYIEHISFLLDAKILLQTIGTVVTGKGAR